MKKSVEGQLEIWDILSQGQETKVPPILLHPGNVLYLAKKGEVKKLTVYEEKSWLCDREPNNRRYRGQFESGSYCVVDNASLGIEVFKNKKDAIQMANAWMLEHDVIRKEQLADMAGKIEAYTYIRDCDKRQLYCFWCELPDGNVYTKGFVTYHHIEKNTKKNRKKFLEEVETYSAVLVEDYCPDFKNLYKCDGYTDWLYAECDYTNAIG